MFDGPHFETKTSGVGVSNTKRWSAHGALLAIVLAFVVIPGALGALRLLTYAPEAHAQSVGTDRLTPELTKPVASTSQTNNEEPTTRLGRAPPKKSMGGTQRTGPSREDVEGRAAGLQNGELLLSVPRLGLRDVRVPSGSTQAKLDREGIIRLETSGLPSEEGSNTYIVGHRMGYPRTRVPYVFYKLNTLRPRDRIVVEDHFGNKYVYEVYDQITGPPSLYWLTHPVEGKTVISLQTCTPIPSFEDRLIVRGELVSVSTS